MKHEPPRRPRPRPAVAAESLEGTDVFSLGDALSRIT